MTPPGGLVPPGGLGPLAAPGVIAAPWPNLRWSWADARPRPRMTLSGHLARLYYRSLASVSGQIGEILRGRGEPERKQALLREYARTLTPWAEALAGDVLERLDRRNREAWRSLTGDISDTLTKELTRPIDGISLRKLIDVNVGMIRDLPEGAARQIADLVADAQTGGLRAETIAERIAGLEGMTRARAERIARTELSKANTAFTRVRAESVGSEGYVWRTSRDGDVRDSHGRMEGVFVRWAEPPMLDGYAAHAGEFVNCRCYPEPVIPLPGGRASSPALGPAARSRWERVNGPVSAGRRAGR